MKKYSNINGKVYYSCNYAINYDSSYLKAKAIKIILNVQWIMIQVKISNC